MKILIVGSLGEYAIERFYFKYLSMKDGVQTKVFEAPLMFQEYYNSSLLNKILFRAGNKRIYNDINVQLKQCISHFKPDVILVFKGMEIFPSTLNWASKQKIMLINYNPDNPFIFSGRGSGNVNITKSIPLYNLHLTYDSEVKRRIDDQFGIQVKLLPFGFEIEPTLYDECCKETEINKVCFVGNPDRLRAKLINKLASEGLKIDVYGNGWNSYIKERGIKSFEFISGEEFWKTLRKYRVQLNFMRIHNPSSHNMRTFEVPAVGGILLAPDTKDHRNYFTVGKEIFIYNDTSSCVQEAKNLLSLTDNEVKAIRKSARDRSITSKYTYQKRSDDLFQFIKELKNILY
jgi:spore maturation protein CgeB